MTEKYNDRIQLWKCMLVKDGSVRLPTNNAQTDGNALQIIRRLTDREPREVFITLYLNNRFVVRGAEVVAMGGMSGAAITPSEVFRGALIHGATGVLLAHNHPSGDPMPSEDDIRMTEMCVLGGKVLGIGVYDHLVVTPDAYYSIAQLRPDIFG